MAWLQNPDLITTSTVNRAYRHPFAKIPFHFPKSVFIRFDTWFAQPGKSPVLEKHIPGIQYRWKVLTTEPIFCLLIVFLSPFYLDDYGNKTGFFSRDFFIFSRDSAETYARSFIFLTRLYRKEQLESRESSITGQKKKNVQNPDYIESSERFNL